MVIGGSIGGVYPAAGQAGFWIAADKETEIEALELIEMQDVWGETKTP